MSNSGDGEKIEGTKRGVEMGTITRMDRIIQILDRGKNKSLDELLSELIAENDGVAPNAVTPEYIREKREKELYPTVRYEVGSAYGGCATDGLTVSTRNELEALAERVGDFLEVKRLNRR